ncbi:MAG: hypothetical protein ACTSSQ_01340 [Alphaproteobacteria bacterium]
MGGWVETALGPGGTALQIGAAIVLIGIVFAALLLFRRRRGGSFYGKSRQAKPRLTLLETANIDQRRQLILIRRDKVEHLLLIGGPSDIVVESGIAAGQGEQHLPAQDFAPALAPRRESAKPQDAAQDGAKELSKAGKAKKSQPVAPGAAVKAHEPRANEPGADKSRENQPGDFQPREIQIATGKSQSPAPGSVAQGSAPQNPAAQALMTAGAVMAAGSSGQAAQPSNAMSENVPSQGSPTLPTRNLARDGAPVNTENRTTERRAPADGPADGNGARGPSDSDSDREHDRAQPPVPQPPAPQSLVPQSPVPQAGPVQKQPTPDTAAAAGLAAGVAALTAAAGQAKSATEISARQDTGPAAELKAPAAEKSDPLIGSEDTETMMRRAFGLREGEQAPDSPAPQSPAPGDAVPEEQAREQARPDPSISPALIDPPGAQTAAPVAEPISIPLDTAPAVAPASQEPERREPAPTDPAAPIAPTPASRVSAPDAGQTASPSAKTPPGSDSGMQGGELVSDLSKRLVSSDPGPMLSSLTGAAPGGSAAAAMAASVEAITSPRSEPEPVEANKISEPGEGGQTTLGDLAERLEEALSKQASGTVLEQPVGNVLPEPTSAGAPEPVAAPQTVTPDAVTPVEASPLAAEFGFADDLAGDNAPAPAPQGGERPAEAVAGDNNGGDGKSVIEFASRRKTNKESLEDEMARLLGELTGESAR